MSTLAVTPRRVLRSEWIKLRTLRSTPIIFAVAFAGLLLFGALVSFITVNNWAGMSMAEKARIGVTSRVLAGHLFGELAVGVVGVMAITGEYATGMIRATLAAVPKRVPVLWAKLAVFSALSLVLMTAAAFAAFYIGNAILAAHWNFSLSEPGVLRSVLMTGVVLSAVCALGICLGFILRNTAAAIATLFGILMVLPILAEFAPRVAEYLPNGAMTSLITPTPQIHTLAPWPAFALLCAYLALAIAGALFTLRRKDA